MCFDWQNKESCPGQPDEEDPQPDEDGPQPDEEDPQPDRLTGPGEGVFGEGVLLS